MILYSIGARMYNRSIPAVGDIHSDSQLGADPHSGRDIFYTVCRADSMNNPLTGGDVEQQSNLCEDVLEGRRGSVETPPVSLTCLSLVLLGGTGAGHKGNLINEQL